MIITLALAACPMEDEIPDNSVPKSSNAGLSGLTIAGNSDVDLGTPAAPDNESAIVAGEARIPSGSKDAVTITPSSERAEYTYAKNADGSFPGDAAWLDAAPSSFEDNDYLFIWVTSEDGKNELVYKIIIKLAANIATLDSLFIGGREIDLKAPAATLAGAETAELALISSELTQLGSDIAVAAVPTDSEASIQYDKTSGSLEPVFGNTSNFSLAFNDIVWIQVISSDRSVTLHYKVLIKELISSTPDDWEYSASWAAAFKAALPAPSYYNTLGENWEWPDLYKFWDGSPVVSKVDWKRRYQEIKIILQHYLYGYLPPAPTSTFTYNASARTITIAMSYEGNTATVTTGAITWPTNTSLYPQATGMPLSFGGTTAYDGAKGYALMNLPSGTAWNTAISSLYSDKMAADDYPGDLMRTAWGLERIIDAIEYLNAQPSLGGMQYKIDPAKTTITGHSRGGKDAIVGAAFSRVSVSAPSSSGAYGVAPERFIRTIVLPTREAKEQHYNGKGHYYLSVARGSGSNGNAVPKKNWILPVLKAGELPPDYAVAYGPIQSIQNYDHGRWDSTAGGSMATNTMSTWPGPRMKQFTSNNLDQFYTAENGFQDKGSMAQIPFDSHYLTALMAGPDPDNPRGLIITVGGDGDSWVNPEGCYFVFLVTRQLFEWLGKGDNIAYFMDTPNGHTHTSFRRARQTDLCEYMWKGTALPQDTIADNTGFLMRDSTSPYMGGLIGRGAAYPLDIRDYDDYMLIKTAPRGYQSIAQIAEQYFLTNPSY
jgi:hypothetical protein